MKNPDLYTKLILTIIAACLVIIAFRDTPAIPSVQAQVPGATDVNIVAVNGHPIRDGEKVVPISVEEVNGWEILGKKVPVTE